MILRYNHLTQHEKVFQSMTGLWCLLFDELVEELEPAYVKAEQARLERANRQRALGGGKAPELGMQDQMLLTVVWLRCYPKQNVLGYLFGVSQATVSRVIRFVLPLLEQAGRDTMRLPDPGRKARRDLPALLAATPGLAIVIDTFEQRVQRPQGERKAADAYYSGKKKQHTLKSQVAVDIVSGLFVDVAESVVGPQSDLKTLVDSQLLERLPADVRALADLAYVGIDKLHPNGRCPIRKPKGKPRNPEQIAFNTAFSRQRIIVEHSICRLRRFESLTQTDRHHRRHHTARVVAVAGLVNRRLRLRFPYPA
jgi:DDE superfamily endonuclease/Helix-turn-helix of DDE superfamily endonuclease